MLRMRARCAIHIYTYRQAVGAREETLVTYSYMATIKEQKDAETNIPNCCQSPEIINIDVRFLLRQFQVLSFTQ